MSLTGYQFDKMRVTPAADGLVFNHLMHNLSSVVTDYRTELEITDLKNGSITLGAGAAVLKGRTVVVSADEQLTPPDNTTSSLCLIIDLSKENSASGSEAEGTYEATNNQVSVNFVTGSIQQEDINDDGSIFMCRMATIVRAGTSITITKDKDFYTPFRFTPEELKRLDRASGVYTTQTLGNSYYYFERMNGIVFMHYYTATSNIKGVPAVTLMDQLPTGYKLSESTSKRAMAFMGYEGESTYRHMYMGGIGEAYPNDIQFYRASETDVSGAINHTGLWHSGSSVYTHFMAWYFTDDPFPD